MLADNVYINQTSSLTLKVDNEFVLIKYIPMAVPYFKFAAKGRVIYICISILQIHVYYKNVYDSING